MKSLSRVAYLIFGLAACSLGPQAAKAAMAPSAVGSAIEASAAVQIEEVRRGGGGGRGWGGRGFRGGHVGIRRGHWGGPRWGGRRHWGRPVYWGGGGSCIRRGWVWNGWQYAWRRYRVC